MYSGDVEMCTMEMCAVEMWRCVNDFGLTCFVAGGLLGAASTDAVCGIGSQTQLLAVPVVDRARQRRWERSELYLETDRKKQEGNTNGHSS